MYFQIYVMTMKFHTTDVLILLLGIVGIVTVAVLEFKYTSGKTEFHFVNNFVHVIFNCVIAKFSLKLKITDMWGQILANDEI